MPEVPLPTQTFAQGPTKYSATEVQAMVRTMDVSKTAHRHLKDLNPEEFLTRLRSENSVLYEEYPVIFALHADDKLDETFFYMLKQKRRMEKGEITEDQASAQVGQKLFNRWVAPLVNGTSAPQTMSYSEYYKSLQ